MQARFAVPTCRLRAPRGLMGVLNEVGREGGESFAVLPEPRPGDFSDYYIYSLFQNR